MPSISYRSDYVKFFFTATPERAAELHREFVAAVHTLPDAIQRNGGFKLRALGPLEGGPRRYALEAWGGVAIAANQLPYEPWLSILTRYDVCAALWEVTPDDILATGHIIERADIGYNVHSYNTKPRSKAGGRDAGGKGFAIGSHKSDLRVSFYIRGRETPKAEIQCKGDMLERLKGELPRYYNPERKLGLALYDLTKALVGVGNARIARAWEQAGLGTSWPAYSAQDADGAVIAYDRAGVIELAEREPVARQRVLLPPDPGV